MRALAAGRIFAFTEKNEALNQAGWNSPSARSVLRGRKRVSEVAEWQSRNGTCVLVDRVGFEQWRDGFAIRLKFSRRAMEAAIFQRRRCIRLHGAIDEIAEKYRNEQRRAAQVEKIIAETKLSIPKRYNHRRLRSDIDWAVENVLHIYQDLGDKHKWRMRHERMLEIGKAAQRLLEMLSDEDGRWCADRLSRQFPHPVSDPKSATPSLARTLAGVRRLQRTSLREISSGSTSQLAPLKMGGAIEELVSVNLKTVFERWFTRATAHQGRSIDNVSRPPKTPFVNFVLAVFEDKGIMTPEGTPYERSTIMDYFKKRGRTRRKERRPERPLKKLVGAELVKK